LVCLASLLCSAGFVSSVAAAKAQPTSKQFVQLKQVISSDKWRYRIVCFCISPRDSSFAEIELHFSHVSSHSSKSIMQQYPCEVSFSCSSNATVGSFI